MSDVFTSLTGGFLENLQLFAATLILAIPLGLIITLGSMSRITPLKWLVRTFIWIIRGTPLMLQLFVVLVRAGTSVRLPDVQPLYGGDRCVRDQLRLLFFGDFPRRHREYSEGAV